MPTPRLTLDKMHEAVNALRQHKTAVAAATALGIPRGTFEARIHRAKQVLGVTFSDDPPKTGLEVSIAEDSGSLTSVSPRVKTLDQALEAAKVDLSVWMVERYTVNKWESAGKDDNNKMQVCDLWQVKVWLKRKPREDPEELGKAILTELARLSKATRRVTHKAPAAKGPVLELDLPDVHIGKLAWSAEAGDNYDSRRAVGVFHWAISDLLAKAAAYKPSRIVMPIGNDLVHVDTIAGTTTGGTHVDSDGRWRKMFAVARAAVVEAIEQVRQVAPVEVIIVPGNHDRASCFMLGEVLSAYFRNDRSVTVDNTPPTRKYRTFGGGAVLVGWAHGDEIKQQDLPLLMGRECPREYGKAKHRAWHLGHYHKAKEVRHTAGDTHGGVSIRVIPSLSGTDSWHFDKGFVGGIKAAEAFVWTGDGLAAQLFAHAPERFYQ